MKRNQIIGTLIASTFLVSGCVSQNDRAASIENRLTDHLSSTAFQDTKKAKSVVATAKFEDALKLAVESDPQFLSAQAAEKASFAQVGVATSARRPQVSATASGGALKEASPSNREITGVAADIMMSQLIYDGGAANAAIDGALARALSARAATQETGNAVALEALRAWADLWVLQQRLSALNARSADITTLSDQLDRMTANGMLDSATRDSARIAVLDFKTEEASLRSGLAGAEAKFARHFGFVPAGNIAAPRQLFSGQDLRKLQSDISLSPTVRKAAAELIAAEAAEKEALSQFKPTVALNMGVMSPMDEDDTTDTTIGLQMRYTFNDGGRRKSQAAAATARKEASSMNLESAKAEATARMAGALAQLTALEQTAPLIAQKLTASNDQASTAEAQIALGQSTLRGLLDARIAQYRALEQSLKLTAERAVLQGTIAAGAGMLTQKLGVE
ncbi:TolC family protein [Tabrizicola sp.]|uniref:TolC family protein n=1 Tax=Tabrizicola sp. TaxID=2005166 RepID=UPI003D2717C1